jgi:hypothetical protein
MLKLSLETQLSQLLRLHGNHLISVIIFFKTDQQRKTKAITSRFAKYLDNVPGSDPVILVSLHYIRDEENLVLAIIKVANLKPLFNNKMPGNVHCMLQCRVFPDFPKGKGAGEGGDAFRLTFLRDY